MFLDITVNRNTEVRFQGTRRMEDGDAYTD